jgi:hypothetical protein
MAKSFKINNKDGRITPDINIIWDVFYFIAEFLSFDFYNKA